MQNGTTVTGKFKNYIWYLNKDRNRTVTWFWFLKKIWFLYNNLKIRTIIVIQNTVSKNLGNITGNEEFANLSQV